MKSSPLLLSLFWLTLSGQLNRWPVVLSSPMPISSMDVCRTIRQMYQHGSSTPLPLSSVRHGHQHRHHQSVSNPHSLLNCPASASSTSCCHGIDGDIGRKALEEFHHHLISSSMIENFAQKFEIYHQQIHLKMDYILNETRAHANEVTLIGKEPRIMSANENLFRFIRSVVFHPVPGGHNQQALSEHIDRLLEAIFISVLQQQQSHQKKYPQDYETCLLNTLKENSDILSKTKDEMLLYFTKTIRTASLIVNTLDHSLEWINQTMNQIQQQQSTGECIRRLSRTFHCHRCSLSSDRSSWPIKPCPSVCRETFGTCLDRIPLDKMDQILKTLIDTYNQLVNVMVNFYNPEKLMSSHYEAMERAQESIRSQNDKISKNARLACGSLKRYSRSNYDYYNYSSTPSSTSTVTGQDMGQSAEFSLFVLIQSVAHQFSHHKSMLKDLDGKLCNAFGSASDDTKCWDGTDIVNSYHPSQRSRQKLSANLELRNDTNVAERSAGDGSFEDLYERVKDSAALVKELSVANSHQNSKPNHRLGQLSESDDSEAESELDGGSGSGGSPLIDDEDNFGPQEGSGMEVDSGDKQSSNPIPDTSSDIEIRPEVVDTPDLETGSPAAATWSCHPPNLLLLLATISFYFFMLFL